MGVDGCVVGVAGFLAHFLTVLVVGVAAGGLAWEPAGVADGGLVGVVAVGLAGVHAGGLFGVADGLTGAVAGGLGGWAVHGKRGMVRYCSCTCSF